MKLKLLVEEEENPSSDYSDLPPDPMDPTSDQHQEQPEDSLDNQIDSYLIDFESQALQNTEDNGISESLTNFFMFEEEEEEAPADGEEKDLTDDNATINKEPVPIHDTPDSVLNVDQFAKGVARLIKNYENLVDIPKTVYTRGYNFLKNNYGPEVAAEFQDVIANQHGIEFDGRNDLDDIVPPTAAGADAMGDAGGGTSL